MTKTSQAEIINMLLKEIQRLKDLHEVQEVMSRYFHWHTAGLHKQCWDKLFAHQQADVCIEIANWGKWEGLESVKNFYYRTLPAIEGDRIGQMMVHSIDTPSIQIAGDGKTAKGVWFSPGHETNNINGKLQANWCWSYFGTDFFRENGEWKIWHYHCYAMFKTPFEKSWLEAEPTSPGESDTPIPDNVGPNKPYTYFNGYTPTSVRELVPAPPEPYETFDPSKAY
jgi:hypothetical protein